MLELASSVLWCCMRLRPRWWIGLSVYLGYVCSVAGAWAILGIDYAEIASPANLKRAIIIPLGIVALALAAFHWLTGWWSAATYESRLDEPIFLILLLLPMAGYVGLNLYGTGWLAIGFNNALLLAVAMLLVAFCQEMVTRGILVVALRGSLQSETWVWFWSTTLFALMHLPNAFFGLGALALVQVVAAFCAGTGLYLIRRLCGNLWMAIGTHALWNFSNLAFGLGQQKGDWASVGFLIGSYGFSMLLLIPVLRRTRF